MKRLRAFSPTSIGRSIRTKLLLALAALALVGILNTAVQEWGARNRADAFASVRDGLERRRALAHDMERVKDYFNHVTVLSGVIGVDAVSPSAADRRAAEQTVAAIPLHLRATVGDRESFAALIDRVDRLAASWTAFHEKQETDPAGAIEELVLRADPLAEELLAIHFPDALLAEDSLVAAASSRFVRADRTASLLGWLIFLVSASLAAFLVWLTARDIGRSLRQLMEGARRIGRGDLGHRIPVTSRDELGALSRAFNHMAGGLQSSQRELETRNEELDRMLQELRFTQQELVQSEKLSAMGGMLAGLAHELNNPLASVLGHAELLSIRLAELGAAAPAELRDELVNPIVADALRARDLVRDMLQFSRKSSTTLQPVDVGEAVRVMVGLRSHAFAHAEIQLDVEQEEDLWVRAEAQRLQQIFVNLANNTLDALTEAGGTRLLVRARSASDEEVVITFEDDGPGLAEPERVFDPFYTTKPVGSGTGLGLTLVHRFVAEFGGSISAANAAGGGARFEIRLRRAPAPAPGAGVGVVGAVRSAGRVRNGNGAAAPTGDAGRHVLVVEDEEPIRRLHVKLLTRMGLRVTAVDSATEARSLLVDAEVDLVISDVKMPGELSGYDLFTWVEAERPALRDRFLFVTGDVHDPVLAVLREEFPERFLTKPFKFEEYTERITRSLEQLAASG
jgi:signal transduction histidine kinase/CheY-like chemotaxis protein